MEILEDNNDEAEDVLKTATTTTAGLCHEELVTKLSDSDDNWEVLEEEIDTDKLTQRLDNVSCHIIGGDHLNNDQRREKIDQNVNKNATNLTAGRSSCYTKSALLSPKSFPSFSFSSSPPPSLSSSSKTSSTKPDQSDSDSGVSDLSLDLTFYKSAKKYLPTSTSTQNYIPKEKEVSKPFIDGSKRSKMTRKHSEYPHPHKSSQMQEKVVDNLFYWAKLIFLFFIISFLIFVTFILSHVKCFNSICAISIESQISYHKYASPI